MKILIWCNYGDYQVYDIDTPEKLVKQLHNIMAWMENWHMDEYLEKTKQDIENNLNNWPELFKIFSRLKHTIGEDTECFEVLKVRDLL